MYNSLVEKCFKDCVDSFRRKDLDSNEEKVESAPTSVAQGIGGCSTKVGIARVAYSSIFLSMISRTSFSICLAVHQKIKLLSGRER